MCLFTSHRDSDQSMITLRMDCNYGLRISSRLCKRVWIQWELHDTSMIYVVFWFILYLTNSGLNLPVGVWTLLSSVIQLPNFMTLIQLHVLLAVFLTAHSGAIKTSPTRESYLSLTEHVLIYFLLKIRMCSIAVIDGEGACMVHCNLYECLCGLSGSQRSERSHISIYFSLLLAQRVELSFFTSDVGEFICYIAQTWCLHSTYTEGMPIAVLFYHNIFRISFYFYNFSFRFYFSLSLLFCVFAILIAFFISFF